MLSIVIAHVSRMRMALSHLYKLPGEKQELKNHLQTPEVRKVLRPAQVQHSQMQAELAPLHSELQNNGNNQRYRMVLEACPCRLLGK